MNYTILPKIYLFITKIQSSIIFIFIYFQSFLKQRNCKKNVYYQFKEAFFLAGFSLFFPCITIIVLIILFHLINKMHSQGSVDMNVFAYHILKLPNCLCKQPQLYHPIFYIGTWGIQRVLYFSHIRQINELISLFSWSFILYVGITFNIYFLIQFSQADNQLFQARTQPISAKISMQKITLNCLFENHS